MAHFKMFYSGSTVAGSVKSAPGHVCGVLAKNSNVAARYLQLFDVSNGTPTGTPKFEMLIKPGDSNEVGDEFFGEHGVYFTNGICWGFSTTSGSYVAGTAADHSLTVTYDPDLS